MLACLLIASVQWFNRLVRNLFASANPAPAPAPAPETHPHSLERLTVWFTLTEHANQGVEFLMEAYQPMLLDKDLLLYRATVTATNVMQVAGESLGIEFWWVAQDGEITILKHRQELWDANLGGWTSPQAWQQPTHVACVDCGDVIKIDGDDFTYNNQGQPSCLACAASNDGCVPEQPYDYSYDDPFTSSYAGEEPVRCDCCRTPVAREGAAIWTNALVVCQECRP